jgi:MoaA/NifB/PqqE/SkfB family radical SAM enzyme
MTSACSSLVSPILCNYYVTLRCNAQCRFCDIWKNKVHSTLREQSLEEIAANLTALRRIGVRVVDFTGGEPLLFSGLPEALELAKNLGFYTSVTTNTLLYPELAVRLKGKVDFLLFSVDSAIPEKHDRSRGVSCFHSLRESIRKATELGESVLLNHVVTDSNVDSIQGVVDFARAQGVMLKLQPCFAYGNVAGLSPQRVDQLAAYGWKRDIIVDQAYLRFIKKGGNDPHTPMCRAVTSTVVISPDNCLVLPCYHRQVASIPIGETGLESVLQSEEVRGFTQQQGRWSFCKGCTVYCYMRSSFYRSFPSALFFLSLSSAAWATANRMLNARKLRGQVPKICDVDWELQGPR